jgi:DNA-binding HxlR family transcriptional regulator
MQRKRLDQSECPVARCVDQIGDWWSLLILLHAIEGATRFEEFEKRLGIAPTILTRRLRKLVHDGLLKKQRYCERPPRDEYLLTQKGQDFQPVVFSLLVWGNRYFSPEGAKLVVMDTKTGEIADPVLIDRNTGKEIDPTFQVVCGPAASAALQERLKKSSKARKNPTAPLRSKPQPAQSASKQK